MTYSQRDILLVPVPFTDLSSVKRRPVLVISNNAYNSKTSDILVAAITSNIQENPYGLTINSPDLEQGSLPLMSQIRADKIYALNSRIVSKKFGKLKRAQFEKVVRTISGILQTS